MKNLAELLPFDEGTALLEIPKASPRPTITPVETTSNMVRLKTSSLKLVDEGFSYTGRKSKRGWGSVVTVLFIALSVLLGFSGGGKTMATGTVSAPKKTTKSPPVGTKKNSRRQRGAHLLFGRKGSG